MLGMDARCSPLTLFHRLRGTFPETEDNELLREGREFEDAIARIAAWKFSLEVDGDNSLELRCGVLSGHPDRFFCENRHYGVLEIKNTLFGEIGKDGWGAPGTDEVPRSYWMQAQVYAHLAKKNPQIFDYPVADYAYIAARLRHGVELYRIPYDPEVVAKIEHEAVRFLDRVANDDPPEPLDEQDARMRWLVSEEKEAVCGDDVLQVARSLALLKKQKKEVEAAIEEQQMLLLAYAKDASTIVHEDPATGVRTAIATLSASRKFNEHAFLADHPEMLARYSKLDVSRLAKEQRKLHAQYMQKPDNVLDQTRVIRLKLKEQSDD